MSLLMSTTATRFEPELGRQDSRFALVPAKSTHQNVPNKVTGTAYPGKIGNTRWDQEREVGRR